MKSIEMLESNTDPPLYTESQTPMFFAHLTSFKPNQWPAVNQQTGHLINYQDAIRFDSEQIGISAKQSEVKHSLDRNNNNIKQSPSLFQMAKNFCGNIMKKHKPNIESGLDEITIQMASLRFTA